MKESGRKHGTLSPCAACKLLRRRCAQDCVFAPYFPADEPQKFASVHKVFGASNVNKMLQCREKYPPISTCLLQGREKKQIMSDKELPEHQRSDAVSSMVYEANARVRDPVYGCVGAISSLQQQIDSLQTQLAIAQAEVVHMRMRQFVSTSPNNNNNNPDSSSPQNLPHGSASSKFMPSQAKSFYCMDMVDQPNMAESLWSY